MIGAAEAASYSSKRCEGGGGGDDRLARIEMKERGLVDKGKRPNDGFHGEVLMLAIW
jgi:hypothetical protein